MKTNDERLIARLLDGELSDTDARQLKERLKNEPDLRLLATSHQQLSKMFDTGREAPAVSVPADFASRVFGAIREDHRQTANGVATARWVALAACFVLAVCILVSFAAEGLRRTPRLEAGGVIQERRIQRLRESKLPVPEAELRSPGLAKQPAETKAR